MVIVRSRKARMVSALVRRCSVTSLTVNSLRPGRKPGAEGFDRRSEDRQRRVRRPRKRATRRRLHRQRPRPACRARPVRRRSQGSSRRARRSGRVQPPAPGWASAPDRSRPRIHAPASARSPGHASAERCRRAGWRRRRRRSAGARDRASV